VNNLERRIGRLELTLGTKPGPRHITLKNIALSDDIILTNVDFSDGEEDPLFPGVWALVYGEPLTSEEIQKLREEYQEGRL
jgi:hypothetical protein